MARIVPSSTSALVAAVAQGQKWGEAGCDIRAGGGAAVKWRSPPKGQNSPSRKLRRKISGQFRGAKFSARHFARGRKSVRNPPWHEPLPLYRTLGRGWQEAGGSGRGGGARGLRWMSSGPTPPRFWQRRPSHPGAGACHLVQRVGAYPSPSKASFCPPRRADLHGFAKSAGILPGHSSAWKGLVLGIL